MVAVNFSVASVADVWEIVYFQVTGRQIVRTVAQAGLHPVVILIFEPRTAHDSRIHSELICVVNDISEQKQADCDQADIEKPVVPVKAYGLFFHLRSISDCVQMDRITNGIPR